MRGRPRKFDHDEAVRLYREENVSARAIGRRLGVSGVAVARALHAAGVTVEAHRPPDSSVSADDLRCVTCREWKPDERFPRNRTEPYRRGRHSVCRDCQAVMRQKARAGRMVPCVNCGAPRTHEADAGARRNPTGLCRPCYYRSLAHA